MLADDPCAEGAGNSGGELCQHTGAPLKQTNGQQGFHPAKPWGTTCLKTTTMAG